MIKIDYIFGDSIATGIANNKFGKKRDGTGKPVPASKDPMGISRVGANPAEILGFLKEIGGEELKNKNIILSTGLSNGSSNIDGSLKKIEEQFNFLKDGGRRVYIVGISNNPTQTGLIYNTPKLIGQGVVLKALADRFKFTYLGDFVSTDGLHPNYSSYYTSNIAPKLASDKSVVTPVPITVQQVAAQVVSATAPVDQKPAPSPGKLYNKLVFNVEKTNILVPVAKTLEVFNLGELTIVKREYTPQQPTAASTTKPNTDIGEFSDMAPVDIPPLAPTEKSSPSNFTIKPKSYSIANKKDKAQIMIHYSAGWQRSDLCKQTVDVLMSRNQNDGAKYLKGPDGKRLKPDRIDPSWVPDKLGLTYHYIIAVDGHIENLVDPKNTAFHANGANYYAIGISLQCLGTTFHKSTTGVLLSLEQADKLVDGYRLNSRTPDYRLGQNHVELVDFNENKTPYRAIRFSQEVSDEQLRSLSSLLKKLRKDFPNIPAWDGLTQEKFDILFPKSGLTYKADKPGIYSHCSLTTEKVDMLPTPRIIKFLKAVRF